MKFLIIVLIIVFLFKFFKFNRIENFDNLCVMPFNLPEIDVSFTDAAFMNDISYDNPNSNADFKEKFNKNIDNISENIIDFSNNYLNYNTFDPSFSYLNKNFCNFNLNTFM